MKKLLTALISVVLITGLTGCGPKTVPVPFTAEDLVFSDGNEEIPVELNQVFFAFPEYSCTERYEDYEYSEYDAVFSTARGLTVGSTVQEYREAYFGKNSNAAWELVGNEEITRFRGYNGEDPAEVAEDGETPWLDCGFYLEDGEWKPLTGYELSDIWLCNVPEDQYDEVVIISACIDEDGLIYALSMNYIDYGETFFEYQGWEE